MRRIAARRVWLRREVMPRLERGAARDLVDVLARQAEVLRDDDELLDALAAQHSAQDAIALSALPVALARRVGLGPVGRAYNPRSGALIWLLERVAGEHAG